MESRAKLFGHPIHQMLIVLPLGVLAMSLVFDLIAMFTARQNLHTAAFSMIAAGVVSGLLAAVFGLIDYLAIPVGTRARRVGTLHGGGNVVVVVLFALSWLLRMGETHHVPGALAFILSLAGALLALVTGWLGGELIDRLGVGVSREANLDAPASFETGIRL